jgi:hypothetical protein
MKLEFSREIFEKVSNIKIHKNPSSGSRVVPCGQTDGHDEANSRLLQFCERASEYEPCYWLALPTTAGKRLFPCKVRNFFTMGLLICAYS